ncbi:hypothetical protein TSAR_015117 [Trichomalopsis sarcophagae]|uniref:Uncharacterized protein n=1 Tax=Trichomalopsis sarcophagae TaxID=543379 RepID=A0A232EIL4_9HYME|nr:hypothetical protein TSAR_015117 [Trichomalopsis sarcophagae]
MRVKRDIPGNFKCKLQQTLELGQLTRIRVVTARRLAASVAVAGHFMAKRIPEGVAPLPTPTIPNQNLHIGGSYGVVKFLSLVIFEKHYFAFFSIIPSLQTIQLICI